MEINRARPTLTVLVITCLLLAGNFIFAARAATGASASTTKPSLDFQVFKNKIEPVFLKRRDNGVMCYNCHSVLNTRLRLQPLSPGATHWSEAQSRRNFAVVVKLVTPGDPLKSRLLLHPLAVEAGGDPMHTGGKFWKSTNDPEWQMIAEWVRATSTNAPTAQDHAAATPAQTLDYNFFKSKVEPVFLTKRTGHARCYSCHTRTDNAFSLQKLSPGKTNWTEEQSRINFEVVSKLVVPSDPSASRLLMHPLAPQAGGDPFHSGGRQFASKKDPAWMTLAEWVRAQTAMKASAHVKAGINNRGKN